MLIIIFVNALLLLQHVVVCQILVPPECVNVVHQMRVVIQAKHVAQDPVNAEVPQHVLGRHQVPSVMLRTTYANVPQPSQHVVELLTLVQAEFVSAGRQMRVATLENYVLLDHANVALHQLVLDKLRDLIVMLQTMYVSVLQV